MNLRTTKSFLCFALFASAACSTTDTATTSEELEGVPEVAAVEMRLTGSAPADGTATEADAVNVEEFVAEELEQSNVPPTTTATDLLQVRGAVKQLNESVREFLGPVAAMVRDTEPTKQVGKLRLWGPVTRGATEYRFLLRHAGVHRYGWRLEARLADTSDAYRRVASGEIVVGAQARRGVGVMGFDLNELRAVDPTVIAQGQVLLGFKHGDLGTSVGYAVRGFTRDPATHAGVDALLRAVHLQSGFNRVRLAYHGNVEGTATAAEELILARVRHRAGVGGRSDVVAIAGDVPTGEALVVSQCWNAALESGFREVRTCPLDSLLGANCVVTKAEGDASACPELLRNAELPPIDPAAPMTDADDPNSDVAPPAEMPLVDGEDG